MNKELQKLLKQINDKKNEVKSLVNDGKLDKARAAKEELVELQNRFDLLYDLDEDEQDGIENKVKDGTAKQVGGDVKPDKKNIVKSFVNIVKDREKFSEWQVIPEIEVTCRGERLFINSVTVEQYKKYISLMEKNDTEKFSGVMFFNKKIMQEMFGNELSLAAVGEIDAVEFLTAIKTVHFIMQNIVAEKMLSIVEVEQVEKEASAFDDYDRENGYEDEDEQPEENQWKVCGEIVDRVVKIAIRLLKNSYSQCMKENIVTLLDYLKFELDTINENQ